STSPFFRSFVVATDSSCLSCLQSGVEDEQFLGDGCQHVGAISRPDGEGVLDSDSTPPRKIDAGLDRDSHAIGQCTRCAVSQGGSLVDFQADTVPGAVAEVLAIPGVVDDRPAGLIHGDTVGADRERVTTGLLCRGDEVVDLSLPIRGLDTDDSGACAVGVVTAVLGSEVDLQKVARRTLSARGTVMRYRAVRACRDNGVEGQCIGTVCVHTP